ncbi:MAG: HAMP domain-containing protein [Nitrospina sp.]|nr:HAMP domain-containing protein [Nitrospina sp.]
MELINNLSLKKKIFGAFTLLFLVLVGSGLVITSSLFTASDDTKITNALGRQRMLTQAMSKSVLSYGMAQSRKKTIEQQISDLDRFITKMRGIYTEMVVKPAKATQLAISMDPSNEPHPAIPFPATFTRLVNEKVGEGRDFTVGIISDDPVNPKQVLATSTDREANEFLKKNPDKVFTKVYEDNGKLYMGLYTADLATVAACASCHTAMKGKEFKVGDMLGIRNYRLVFANDIGIGRSELNATLEEFDNGKKIFADTLNAVKNGGRYPLDLQMTQFATLERVSDPEVQNKLEKTENIFNAFLKSVTTMVDAEPNSDAYRKAQFEIITLGNQLRSSSSEAVERYAELSEASMESIFYAVGISTGVSLVLLIIIATFFSKSVITPLQNMSRSMEKAADGNLALEQFNVTSKDEIGILFGSFNRLMNGLKSFMDYSKEILAGNTERDSFNAQGEFDTALQDMLVQARERKEIAERERKQSEELQNKVDQMLKTVQAAAQGDLTQEVTVNGNDAIGQMGAGLSNFLKTLRSSISKIGQNSTMLTDSSSKLSSVSQQMAGNAEETSAQADVVTNASTQVNANMNSVAAASEQMSASIREIAENSSKAAKVANDAVEKAKQTNETVSKLGDSSAEIGQVIKVINSIAEQTNLLALNATIEAARAGEAGKGFAVVANEVKELANATAKATEEISQKIQAIQEDTGNAVSAIAEITDVINQISDISATIASAVEEQTATTNEIGRSVNEAARGSSEISENISGVAVAAKSTTEGATDTQVAATEMSKMASDLQELVNQFKY